MKVFLLLLALILAGCASSYRVIPSQVEVALVNATSQGKISEGTVNVPIRVTNNGPAVLEIGVDAAAGVPAEPFRISWLYYQVFTETGGVDVAHGPGGHGPMPPNTLRIGPGDSAKVTAVLYGLTAFDCPRTFRIRFQDLDDNWYTTEAFAPCTAP
jgi:hypothetical protein